MVRLVRNRRVQRINDHEERFDVALIIRSIRKRIKDFNGMAFEELKASSANIRRTNSLLTTAAPRGVFAMSNHECALL